MFSDIIPLNIGVSTLVTGGYFPGFDDPLIEPSVDSIKELHIKLAFEHYQKALMDNQALKAWFFNRSISMSDDMIKRFNLGFADNSLGKIVSREHGRQSEYFRGNMQQVGLYKPTGYPFFHGDMVFPFFNEAGEIIGAYGRRVTTEKRTHHLYHHHWSIGEALFFNRDALQHYTQIILCKSPVEALTLLCAGIPNVIATMGIYSFDDAHLMELEKHGIKEVVIGFDHSDTGNHVSGLVSQALDTLGINCLRLALPKHSDINRFAQDQGGHKAALNELISHPVPYRQTYENLLG